MDTKETSRLLDAWLGESSGSIATDARLRSLLVIIGYMIVAGGVFLGISKMMPLIYGVIDVATPFVLAFILAYILNPVLRSMQRRLNLTRPGVVIITYLAFGGLMIITLVILLPILFSQGQNLYHAAKQMHEDRQVQMEKEAERRERDMKIAEAARKMVQISGPALMDGQARSAPGEFSAEAQEAAARRPGTRKIGASAGEGSAEKSWGASENSLGTGESLEDFAGSEAFAPRTPAWRRSAREEITLAERLGRSFDNALGSFNSRLMDWWDELTQETLPSSERSKGKDSDNAATTATATSVAATVGTYLGSLLLNFISVTIMISFVVVICFYMLVDYGNIVEHFWQVVPVRHHQRWARILAKIDYSLGGFLRGQLTICVILGLVWALWLMFVMGLVRYALLVAFIAGMFNFIPYLGPAIGSIAASAYVILDPTYSGFMETLGGLALALLGHAIVQALEGFVLQPKLIGSKAQLHPLLIMLALIAGGQFGFAGLLLAVPAACVFKVLWGELVWEPYVAAQREKLADSGQKEFSASAMRIFTVTQERLAEDAELPPGSHMVVKKAREYLRQLDMPRRPAAAAALDSTMASFAESIGAEDLMPRLSAPDCEPEDKSSERAPETPPEADPGASPAESGPSNEKAPAPPKAARKAKAPAKAKSPGKKASPASKRAKTPSKKKASKADAES